MSHSCVSIDKNRRAGYAQHADNGDMVVSIFVLVKNGHELGL